jgi:hypothetical protein
MELSDSVQVAPQWKLHTKRRAATAAIPVAVSKRGPTIDHHGPATPLHAKPKRTQSFNDHSLYGVPVGSFRLRNLQECHPMAATAKQLPNVLKRHNMLTSYPSASFPANSDYIA